MKVMLKERKKEMKERNGNKRQGAKKGKSEGVGINEMMNYMKEIEEKQINGKCQKVEG